MMSLLIFVDRLREQPTRLEVKADPTELDLVDEDFTFEGPVTGQVTFSIAGHDVLASGNLYARVAGLCSRCLAPAHLTLHARVNEIWMPRKEREEEHPIDEDAELTHTYEDETIDPAEVFRELLMAELPEIPHCKSDCKGLCPGCGANLNTEPCRCAPAAGKQRAEASLPSWKAALKNLRINS
ncbi:MAG: DUF177 domain-containing protein [bacterium]|nr:DUF177 domain-containing protein [bacterium]